MCILKKRYKKCASSIEKKIDKNRLTTLQSNMKVTT